MERINKKGQMSIVFAFLTLTAIGLFLFFSGFAGAMVNATCVVAMNGNISPMLTWFFCNWGLVLIFGYVIMWILLIKYGVN